MELLKNIFDDQQGVYITAVEQKNIIIIKDVSAINSYDEVAKTAQVIVDMLNSEAMLIAKVAYGTIVPELKEVSKSYKEAKMALDVGKIFYMEKAVTAYNTLGIGRLIYQLPVNLCRMFINEIFGDTIPEELDDEMLTTVQKFFDNNLNVSETSRQLYVHRNTLVYRIEKLHQATGLDVRKFDDALTFKIALMVVNYMRYLDSLEET
jgi:carbohydrate diacid regulator